MNEQRIDIKNNEIFYRLTALWVVCEAFAGGIMHGIKLPFSGMLVSILAVICITLIAFYVPSKGAILKATIIVSIFKLMLSPHSPPTAYIAVFFQGLMGELFFYNRKHFTVSATILAVLALVESAIQRILVLIILYGSNFWKAVNEFLQKSLNQKTLTNYSATLAIIYILIHAVVGLFAGYYAAQIAKKSSGLRTAYPQLILSEQKINDANQPTNKIKKLKIIFITAWCFLIILYVQSIIAPSKSILPKGEVAQIILRSIIIILSWYLIIAPLLMKLIKYTLTKQKVKKQEQINAVMQLLPETKNIFIGSWQHSAIQHGLKRIKLFIKILLVNTITGEKAA